MHIPSHLQVKSLETLPIEQTRVSGHGGDTTVHVPRWANFVEMNTADASTNTETSTIDTGTNTGTAEQQVIAVTGTWEPLKELERRGGLRVKAGPDFFVPSQIGGMATLRDNLLTDDPFYHGPGAELVRWGVTFDGGFKFFVFDG